MDVADVADDLDEVLVSSDQLESKIQELAAQVSRDYRGKRVLFVGVLKGAVMIMADLARAVDESVEMDFMAVSSYGGQQSSGVVRILKDLDGDISGRHVVLVEDVIDSGLTLSWLVRNLQSRGPASLEILTMLRKPEAAKVEVDVKYVGFDIDNEFVVGYGLDYREKYRNLRVVATLKPEVTARRK